MDFKTREEYNKVLAKSKKLIALNETLTIQLAYKLMSRGKFMDARIIEGLTEKKAIKEIQIIEKSLTATRKALYKHYFGDNTKNKWTRGQ